VKITLVILGLLALLIVGAQTFRHIYVRWVEPRGSVLDQFESQTEKDIAASKPLEDLVARYAETKKRVDEDEAKREAEEAKRPPNSPRDTSDYERFQREPYKSKQQLEQAIHERESHGRQLSELHFYWWCGIVSAVIGFAAYFRLNNWFGLSVMILGYIEMMYATCPSFRSFGAAQEFDTLLTTKVVYSVLTVISVLVFWRYVAAAPAERPR
jgi:hypothetical protein